MIWHFVSDEKFIDGFISNQAKMFPNVRNLYFTWAPTESSLIHIKSHNVVVLKENSKFEDVLRITKAKPTFAIFHGLFKQKHKMLLSIPSGIKTAWVFYGAEVFNRRENVNLFYGPKTRRLLERSLVHLAKNYIKLLNYYLEYFIFTSLKLKITSFWRAVHKIDYFAHWISDDYEFVVNRYCHKRMKYISFCYSNEIPAIQKSELKKYLLVGNSGAITNNHLDVFSEISDLDLVQFEKIIIPLSYSGPKWYVNIIKESAKKRFGEKAIILDSFITKKEYFHILSKVKLALMGHYRSQAGGNIRFFLKNGIDFALYPRNPIFRFCQRNGIKVKILPLSSNEISLSSSSGTTSNKLLQRRLFEDETLKRYYYNLLIGYEDS